MFFKVLRALLIAFSVPLGAAEQPINTTLIYYHRTKSFGKCISRQFPN